MESEPAKEAALEQLASIHLAVLMMEEKRLIQVRKAKDSGASWSELGDRLLLTRSGAWRKYHQAIADVDGTYAYPLPPEAPTV